MFNDGFDNNKYFSLQTDRILKRISQFGGKLYLEFGGKLFDDYHASRVLPGFKPDTKINMLLRLKDKAEIVVVVSAAAIEQNKMRADLGITYDMDALRLIDAFRERGLYVGSVCITHYASQPSADSFIKRLGELGIKVFKHFPIPGYPTNVKLIATTATERTNILKRPVNLSSSLRPVPEAEKWLRLSLSFTTTRRGESNPATRSLRRSRYGISLSPIPSISRMNPLPQTSTT